MKLIVEVEFDFTVGKSSPEEAAKLMRERIITGLNNAPLNPEYVHVHSVKATTVSLTTR